MKILNGKHTRALPTGAVLLISGASQGQDIGAVPELGDVALLSQIINWSGIAPPAVLHRDASAKSKR